MGATCALDDGARESLLVLSDVHLGSDLNDRLPPNQVTRRSKSVDDDLVGLIRHYARAKPRGARWRLVIAGDFIDFIGMAIAANGQVFQTELLEEEREHGLGNTEDHARLKMKRVAARHGDVFAALAAFVGAGHALTMVHGNHDLEFHWDTVKDEFRATLAFHAREQGLCTSDEDARAFDARIEFNPWFFYVGGVAYIEHGHQYDPFCATDHVMAPLSPLDPRRISRGLSEVLLRYVVRPTRGMKEYGHENKGLLDYIVFALRLGFRGVFSLLVRFVSAVVELFRIYREVWSANAQTLRAEHERRMQLVAEATRIGVDRIRALAALQSMPVTHSIRGILASVLLDRLALGLASAFFVLAFALLGAKSGHFFFAAAGVVVAWFLAHRYLARQRKLDPAEDMIDRAAHLARLFPAAFVVMGHTHIPVRVPVADGAATYINVGSWAEEEPEIPAPSQSYRAARTHLVIHVADSGPVAEFLTWDSASGPQRYVG